MEGLIQVLFFLAILIFSMIDAAARRKKRQQEMDELDHPEEDRHAGPLEGRHEGRHEGPRADRPGTESRDRTPWQVASGREGEAEVQAERDEQGADSLIPADLWEEITGMKRPSPPAPRPRPSSQSPAPEQRFPAPDPVPAPSPVPSTWDTPQPTASAGRSTPRSRNVHGREGQSVQVRSSEARQDEFPERKRAKTELGALAEEIREKSRRDLTEVPIAQEVEEVSDAVHPRAGARKFPAAGRRRRAVGVAASLKSSLRADTESLQKAVLYREVLGRPLGSREGAGGWEEPVG